MSDIEGGLTAERSLRSAQVVYLGISGVLHPSKTTYELVHRRSPWDDGHALYEGVPLLESALQRWPGARIVLTSTLPWAHGLPPVLEQLGSLAARVDGFTYEDLTKRAVRTIRTRSGTTRNLTYSNEDYWRMNKSGIVAAHVAWLQPRAWIAIDDDDVLWPTAVARDHLVATDGCAGLQDGATWDRLLTVLEANFGPEGLVPLTRAQHAGIARAAPMQGGKVLESLPAPGELGVDGVPPDAGPAKAASEPEIRLSGLTVVAGRHPSFFSTK